MDGAERRALLSTCPAPSREDTVGQRTKGSGTPQPRVLAQRRPTVPQRPASPWPWPPHLCGGRGSGCVFLRWPQPLWEPVTNTPHRWQAGSTPCVPGSGAGRPRPSAGVPSSSRCTPPPSQGAGLSHSFAAQLCGLGPVRCPGWVWWAGRMWAGSTRSRGCVRTSRAVDRPACPPVTAKPPLGRPEGRRWRERAALSGQRGLVSEDPAGACSSGAGCHGRLSRGPRGRFAC